MVDFKQTWVRFRDLPDDVLSDLPEHVRSTFLAAREHQFDLEMVCAGVRIPKERRAQRRFVLVADDVGPDEIGGPLYFDLGRLAQDARAARRVFIVSSAPRTEIYAACYASAIEDLTRGYDVALVVETRPPFARAWARTLDSLQKGLAVGQAEISEKCSAPKRRRAASGRRAGNA
jgi:hypothetical protein